MKLLAANAFFEKVSVLLIRIGYDMTVECRQDTPLICLLSLRDERRADLHRDEEVILTPNVPSSLYHDLFGNLCRRMVAPAAAFRIWGDAIVSDSGLPDQVDIHAQETPIALLPDETLLYLVGSRYCETDRLSQTAWDMFGDVQPGWARVQAICDFVHRHIGFDYQNARFTRTAFDALQERTGVCRDFAHLAIALIRCMNVPARYVNGYLSDIGAQQGRAMDFCAWIEVYMDGRWITFDPRNNTPRIGRIKVSQGRDAADVPLIHSFGPHLLQDFRVWCYEVDALPA